MTRNFSLDKFNYVVLDVNDTYQWGSHTVARAGVEIIVFFEMEEKRFYIAGKPDRLALQAHMDSLTDDLLGQWFNKREKKPKKVKE